MLAPFCSLVRNQTGSDQTCCFCFAKSAVVGFCTGPLLGEEGALNPALSLAACVAWASHRLFSREWDPGVLWTATTGVTRASARHAPRPVCRATSARVLSLRPLVQAPERGKAAGAHSAFWVGGGPLPGPASSPTTAQGRGWPLGTASVCPPTFWLPDRQGREERGAGFVPPPPGHRWPGAAAAVAPLAPPAPPGPGERKPPHPTPGRPRAAHRLQFPQP